MVLRTVVAFGLAFSTLAAATTAYAACPALPASDASAGAVVPALAGSYALYSLPTLTGGLINKGLSGMVINPSDPTKLLIIDNGEAPTAKIWSVPITRDACNHIVDVGAATSFADVGNADANIVAGPKNSILVTRFFINEIAQVSAGDTTPTWLNQLSPLGVAVSVGGLAVVPPSLAASGKLRALAYDTSELFDLPFTSDATSGQVTFGMATKLAKLQANGLGGISYLPLSSPGLVGVSLAVAEFDTSSVVLYPVDAQGTPDTTKRAPFVTGMSQPWGVYNDPVSGDLLVTGWQTGGRVHVISGFPLPDCTEDVGCAPNHWCSADVNKCAAKLVNGAAIPTQPTHMPALNGTCNAAASAICASGVCDARDDACGFANGAPSTCTATTGPTACRSGICDDDGICGYANGNGTCSPDGGASRTTCRSGVCGSDGKCGLGLAEPCTTSTDCRSADCDATKHCAAAPDASAPDASTPDASSSSSSSSSSSASSTSSSGAHPSDAGNADADAGNDALPSDGACSCDVPGVASGTSSIALAIGGVLGVLTRFGRRGRGRRRRDYP